MRDGYEDWEFNIRLGRLGFLAQQSQSLYFTTGSVSPVCYSQNLVNYILNCGQTYRQGTKMFMAGEV